VIIFKRKFITNEVHTINFSDNIFNQSINGVKVMTGDIVIEAPTKDVILKDNDGFCYRVTVDDYGFLNVLKLISCP
jgi:hypothetical protein